MNGIKVFFAIILLLGTELIDAKENSTNWNPLTSEEKSVIVNKDTEAPFTGSYYNHFEEGTYICKRCDAPLFRSDDKFHSRCGWPSFDDEIPGAIKRVPDSDGERTEIICTNCGAHLGHVFEGEGFTVKNLRHCVNSISLNFISKGEKEPMDTAYFAGGCFWGVEHLFHDKKGVLETRVGYMGGHTKNPTYEEVCSGTTGHVEAIEVKYDPNQTSYEDLSKWFFEIHDPAQVGRQGPDVGEQYQFVIFYTDDQQKKVAQGLIKLLEKKGLKIATQLIKAETFWEAEEYHQDYYEKTGKQPYCHFHIKRF